MYLYNGLFLGNEKEWLIYETTWMELESKMLSKRSQTDSTLYRTIHKTFERKQNVRDKKQISGCQGLGIGKKLTSKEFKQTL